MRYRLVIAVLAAVPWAPAAAQRPEPEARGAAAITADDVRRRIGIIADDSMLGRATPSPQLDQVAAYVAAEFHRFGLAPGGDGGGYLQRYPLEVVRTEPESSSIEVTGGAPATWGLGRDVLLVEGEPPAAGAAGPAVLVTGTPPGDAEQGAGGAGGAAGIDSAAVAGKVVFLAFGPGMNAIAVKVLPFRPLALVLVAPFPDSIWQELPGHDAVTRVVNPSESGGLAIPPVLALRTTSAAPLFARAGVSLDSLPGWAARPLAARPLGDAGLRLVVRQRLLERASAPNVVGILAGRDPLLRKEYVLFTAHMDHIGTPGSGEGCAARGGDSICNGADDDGSGTATVLELARAFATAAGRPRRSLVFMTVSGEERGLWGSAYFADHPTVALDSVVADLNSDMVGRNSKDTMAVIGREHSNLGATLDSVAAAHAELHLTPVGDLWPEEGLYFRSDHYNFARKGIPILFFTSGLHADYHQVSDSPDKIDGDKVARFARLVYYLGLTLANAPARPQWNPESYRRIVKGQR